MKQQLIKKYEAYIAFAEKAMSQETDPDRISALAICAYCYKEILRDLKEPSKLTDEQLLQKFDEAVRQSNMLVGDAQMCLNILKQYEEGTLTMQN